MPHALSAAHAAAAVAFREYADAYGSAACVALAAADVALRAWRGGAAAVHRSKGDDAAAVEQSKAALLAACNAAEAERRWGDTAASAVRAAAGTLLAAVRRLRAAQGEEWVTTEERSARGHKRAGATTQSGADIAVYTRPGGVRVGARDARLAVTEQGVVVAEAGRAAARSWTVARLRDARR